MEPQAQQEDRTPAIKRLWGNKEELVKLGIEPTTNRRGCTYHVFGEPERRWVSSLLDSPLPLLDAGACYGVQTMHALKSGRDVIAVDMSEEHLKVLEERVAKMDDPGRGKLVRTIVTKLPNADILEEGSVSGILCSEMLHFYKPGDLQPQFQHLFRWLAQGGLLVASTGAWPPCVHELVKHRALFQKNRSGEDVLNLLKTLSPAELVDAAPGFLGYVPGTPWPKILGDSMYMLSVEELRELAESAGFEVEDVKYYHSGKYSYDNSDTLTESVFLVARKPLTSNS